MLFCLLLGLVIIRPSSGSCDACLDEVCYSRTTIFSSATLKSQLAIDRSKDIIYFTFENKNDDTEHLNAVYDISKNRLNYIALKSSFGRAVDQKKGKVYISRGKHKSTVIYNSTIGTATEKGFNKSMSFIQFKDHLYFVEDDKPGIYKYENQQFNSLTAISNYTVEEFVVDKLDNVYFVSDFTLYKLDIKDDAPKVFDDIIFSLTTDKFDNAYFVNTQNRSIHKIDYRNGAMKLVGVLLNGRPCSLVFDKNNNPIYYDLETLHMYHLTPTYSRCEIKDGDRFPTFIVCKPITLCSKMLTPWTKKGRTICA